MNRDLIKQDARDLLNVLASMRGQLSYSELVFLLDEVNRQLVDLTFRPFPNEDKK